MQHIVICSMGRSGTTLLQGILNATDGCCIRGENKNFLFGLYRSYQSIKYAKRGTRPRRLPSDPWYGADQLDIERFLADARTMFLNQLDLPPGTAVAGFKEIRWTRAELQDVALDDYLTFISRVLGAAKFLFLTRDIAEIIESQRRAKFHANPIDEGELARSIEQFYRDMRAAQLPVFELDYRDIVDTTSRLRAMYAFLELPYDEDRLNAILAVPHSYAQSSRSLENLSARAAARRGPAQG